MTEGGTRELRPPSGHPPPAEATLPDGTKLDLVALARAVCTLYRDEYPDEGERYGDAGMAWCVHDNRHILNWAVLTLDDPSGFEKEIGWLAGVLGARDFPLDRLARDLEIAADVVGQRVPDANLAAQVRSGIPAVREAPAP